jgi:hypothetical protein
MVAAVVAAMAEADVEATAAAAEATIAIGSSGL